MPTPVLLAFLALVAAAVLLAFEAASGQRTLRSAAGTVVRAGTFGLASVAGVTLLAALSGGEWGVALALVPLTALSILRLWALLCEWTTGPRATLLVLAVLAVGLGAGLRSIPVPLTRAHLHGGSGAAPTAPVSIRPDVGRTVRV